MTLKTSIGLLTILTTCFGLFTACGNDGGGEEPFARSIYYVINDTDQPLTFCATELFSENVFTVELSPNSITEVDRVEGDGHLFPSNFYSTHEVKLTTMDDIEDSTWQSCDGFDVPETPEGDSYTSPICLLVESGALDS